MYLVAECVYFVFIYRAFNNLIKEKKNVEVIKENIDDEIKRSFE